MLGYITLLFSLSDYAISIALNQTQADQINAFLNLGTACGRPFLGVLSDRVGRIKVADCATLLCGILVLVIWLPASSFGVVVFFAVPVGAILGAYLGGTSIPFRELPQADSETQTIGPLCAEIAGLEDLQPLLSISWLSIVLPTLCKWLQEASIFTDISSF
jgi:nitrate/nitrite transporter NarK